MPERPSKLDPFAERLAAWLKTEAGKSRKQRRTLKQFHADLVALGFTGSYGRVAAFAREWRADRQREQQTTGRGTFVPLAFRPGEAFQFDWSEDCAVIGGERTKLQVAHIKLAHSRAFLLRAYLLQTHEMLFDAHWHGVPRLRRRAAARHLRQHEDGGRQGRPRQGAAGQRPLPRDGEPLPLRAGVLQSRVRLGEGAGREERPGCPSIACGSRCRAFLTWRR